MSLKFEGWLKNNREHRPCTSSYVCHSIAIRKLEFQLPSDSAQFRAKSTVFHPVEAWNLTGDLAKPHDTSSMLVQVCASLLSRGWNQTGVTVSKSRILGKTYEILSRMTLKTDIWDCMIIGQLRHWSYGPEKPKLGHCFYLCGILRHGIYTSSLCPYLTFNYILYFSTYASYIYIYIYL